MSTITIRKKEYFYLSTFTIKQKKKKKIRLFKMLLFIRNIIYTHRRE